ncbi:MAG: HD domain-containing protein [Candidatus Bipolaricaulota bacterium]
MNNEKDDLKNLVKFIFEVGQLKRTPRSGWLKLGINDPESVADHSFRTAVIGFILGEMEGHDPYRVASYCLFHDMAETRTGDLDWLAQRYLDRGDSLSSEVLNEQLERLPKEQKSLIKNLFDQTGKEDDLELVARDADLLDLIFQTLEYTYQGNDPAQEWFENTLHLLRSESGKRIGEFLREKEKEVSMENLVAWWKGLKTKHQRN